MLSFRFVSRSSAATLTFRLSMSRRDPVHRHGALSRVALIQDRDELRSHLFRSESRWSSLVSAFEATGAAFRIGRGATEIAQSRRAFVFCLPESKGLPKPTNSVPFSASVISGGSPVWWRVHMAVFPTMGLMCHEEEPLLWLVSELCFVLTKSVPIFLVPQPVLPTTPLPSNLANSFVTTHPTWAS